MIDLAKLTISDIGKWVEYNGSAEEKERGRIKSWNDKFIFVVYKCGGEWDRFQDFTGQATKFEDLHFIDINSERRRNEKRK